MLPPYIPKQCLYYYTFQTVTTPNRLALFLHSYQPGVVSFPHQQGFLLCFLPYHEVGSLCACFLLPHQSGLCQYWRVDWPVHKSGPFFFQVTTFSVPMLL